LHFGDSSWPDFMVCGSLVTCFIRVPPRTCRHLAIPMPDQGNCSKVTTKKWNLGDGEFC
jgi:hypothetical protein